MSTRSAEYPEAIEHLPDGAVLVLPNVTWERYENLLEDLTGRHRLRVTYDEGRLEIEYYKEFIVQLVDWFATNSTFQWNRSDR